MTNYTDEDRESILQAAYETLARTANIGRASPVVPLPETLADRRYREAVERKAEREAEQQRGHRPTDYEVAQLEARLRAELEAKCADLTDESELLKALLAEAFAYLQREIEAKINAAVGELRADIAVQRGVDHGEIIELPNVLRKPG